MSNHHLPQSPLDTNTGKPINFPEAREAGTTGSESSDADEQSPAKQQWKEMREQKINNDIDPSLQSPQDANTGKHINFLETEEEGTTGRQSPHEDEQSPAKQQWKEMREQKINNDIDPSLQSPQDANTGKHINFLETEEEGTTGNPFSDEDE